uniref:Uncharacterized protein n=1 Tax=Canis lupus dingo TaxID=286419 RepID=A0A8C0L8U6_CANLU
LSAWVIRKPKWQKFPQNREAKAPQPVDSCCMRSPPGRSSSALTCSFWNKRVPFRGLRDLFKRPGLQMDDAAPGLRSITRLHPPQAMRTGALCLHAKLLAIYANKIFPINKPNPWHTHTRKGVFLMVNGAPSCSRALQL